MKLTTKHFAAIIADRKHTIVSEIQSQLIGLKYRKDMEAIVFTEDVAESFLSEITEQWDCSDYDENDLIEWTRDIQQGAIDGFARMIAVPLAEFISDNFKSQTEFAKTQNVKPPQVTQWLNKNVIVVDGEMYSHRRTLNV